MDEARQKCPECGSDEVIPIVYGRPTLETSQAARRGEVLLGGCMVTGDDPARHCRKCGHQWDDADLP